MKSIFLKAVFATGVVVLAFSFGGNKAKATTEGSGGGFTCPEGDKYKCAEKDGWVIFKGEGAVVEN